MQKFNRYVLGIVFLAFSSGLFAAPITFTFSTVSADVTGGAAGGVDLVINLNADTGNFQTSPPGPFGSSRYLGLSATVSSVALGLSGVVVTNTLDLLIGAPAGGFPDFVGLTDGSAIVGLTSHPNTVGDLISNWNRVSDFSASAMQTLTDGNTLLLNLAGGSSIGLIRIDGNQGPGQDGSFTATLARSGTVPEPTSWALVLMAVAAGNFARRRSRD